jgi:hypothetical protein
MQEYTEGRTEGRIRRPPETDDAERINAKQGTDPAYMHEFINEPAAENY